ncbi:MAG: polymer-forming cytoskeletal protein [Candidatus Magasanikbacteria bacterium]|nr:polymer-forming cytoskeletal protein [Candidatus Magasanikbacteria bacterium]MCA9390993.1 polymer-forming cytoskeletal protein [Candidatus Magasanikbacteria bacterium]
MSMFGKSTPTTIEEPTQNNESAAVTTIIAKGVRVEGDFSSDGNVTIEGELKGKLSTIGRLIVGKDAVIDGIVKAGSASVAGQLTGPLTVDEGLDLLATSIVKGDIVAKTLSVERGATIDGKTTITGS